HALRDGCIAEAVGDDRAVPRGAIGDTAAMLYAIFCYDNEAVTCAWSKEKDAEGMSSLGVVLDKLGKQGRLGPTARLMPTTAATTIRKGAAPVIMDGPFAETKEQLLGF